MSCKGNYSVFGLEENELGFERQKNGPIFLKKFLDVNSVEFDRVNSSQTRQKNLFYQKSSLPPCQHDFGA